MSSFPDEQGCNLLDGINSTTPIQDMSWASFDISPYQRTLSGENATGLFTVDRSKPDFESPLLSGDALPNPGSLDFSEFAGSLGSGFSILGTIHSRRTSASKPAH